MIKDNVDIVLVSEFKLDETFPVGPFCLGGYSTPYYLDRNLHGGRILLYIREYSPSKMIKFEPLQICFKGLFVEINLVKKKWLISCSHNSNRNNIVNQVKNINTGLDLFSTTYDNIS